MKNYTKYVENIIKRERENTVIEAAILYEQLEESVPEAAYYKVLERMAKRGDIVHITKGLYYRPRQTRLGSIPLGEQPIIEYYAGDNKGVVVGYRLYNKIGITTQVGKNVEIISSNLRGQKKNISNVKVVSCDIMLNADTKLIIETMEVLQNYRKIEDINKAALAKYMTGFASNYSNEAAEAVIDNRKYKKSTIALMKEFLNYHNVSNTLDKYLSSMSDYRLPKMEEFYESAQ